MKIRIVLFSLILWSKLIFACDFCNCYLGINPHYKKNSVGMRYTNSTYFGSHMDETELAAYDLTPQDFSETRTNYEVYGQFYPVQKLQIQFFLPYVVNVESMNDKAYNAFSQQLPNGNRVAHGEPSTAGDSTTAVIQSSTIQGFGDPLLLLNYQLINTNSMDSSGFRQRLFAGAGIKFPLGKSEFDPNEDPLEKTHQPGTGSWDFLPSLSYLAKYRKLGLNLNVSYMITTADKYEFEYANRVNINLNLYREWNIKKLFIYPSLGLYFEQGGSETYGATILEDSGGTLLISHAGLDLYYKSFSLSTAFHIPTVQKLNGNQPQMQQRIIAGVGYAFN